MGCSRGRLRPGQERYEGMRGEAEKGRRGLPSEGRDWLEVTRHMASGLGRHTRLGSRRLLAAGLRLEPTPG